MNDDPNGLSHRPSTAAHPTNGEVGLIDEAAGVTKSENPFGSKFFVGALAVFALILLVTLSFVWSRSSTVSKTSVTGGELTFLNLTNGEDVDNATISPDGNYFVYSSHDGERTHLIVQQTGQATHREIIEPIAGTIIGATFTPDSQFIYFTASEKTDEPNVLYRIPALGGVKTKILTDVVVMPSFSPDGSEITFLRAIKETGRSSLMIAANDGSRERTLVTGAEDEEFFGGGAWAPDGKLIAFGKLDMKARSESGFTIVGTDPSSGETKLLSPEKWDTCFRMAWTHDSQGLVFIGTRAKEASTTRRDQIYYLSVSDGRTHRITTDGSRHQPLSLGITDNDEILAVPFNRTSQIWSMNANGDSRTITQMTSGQSDGRGGITPLIDGRVAYLTRNGDGFAIWTMNGDGSDRKQLTTDPPAIEELRAPSDGRFFVFSAKRDGSNNLYRINSAGQNIKQLTFGDKMEIDSTVSPDGKWVVYESPIASDEPVRKGLWKISSDGGDPTVLADVECSTPNYSPDGRSISCVSADSKNIFVISADDGKLLKTFQTTERPILNMGAKWTPDGQALVYITYKQNVANLRAQPINGDALLPFTDFTSGDIYNFAFSVSGNQLYLARGYQTRNATLIRNFR